jgi:hypothetical protein
MTEVYDLASALSSLGVGEAVVTVLSPAGVPTPVAWTRLYPPSRAWPRPPAPPTASRPAPAPSGGGVDTKGLIQVGKLALRFMNTPVGREIQRSIFGVLRKRR